jgi:hypothetical protein
MLVLYLLNILLVLIELNKINVFEKVLLNIIGFSYIFEFGRIYNSILGNSAGYQKRNGSKNLWDASFRSAYLHKVP